MKMRPKLAVTAIIVVILFAGGALAFSRSSVGTAVLKSRSHFIPCDGNPQVLYEPGMEEPAARVAAVLPSAVARVEAQHHLPIAKPFKIYVCGSHESFNAYMGAPTGATARGVKVLNDIFLSPSAFASWRGDTHGSVLAHELSHLHLYQRLGHRRSLWDMPVWFLEGLAVTVSGGGGEGVTAQDATSAILAGHHFIPDEKGSLLRPKRASDYGMGTFMFYRQSELFVAFIRDRDPAAFGDFLLALQLGGRSPFAAAFESSLGTGIAGMWGEFESHLRSAHGSAGTS
jgi:hypothetical protein